MPGFYFFSACFLDQQKKHRDRRRGVYINKNQKTEQKMTRPRVIKMVDQIRNADNRVYKRRGPASCIIRGQVAAAAADLHKQIWRSKMQSFSRFIIGLTKTYVVVV